MYLYLPEIKKKQGDPVQFSFDQKLFSGNHADGYDDTLFHVCLEACCSGDKLLIKGIVEAYLCKECARCLQPFEYHFQAGFQEAFTMCPGPEQEVEQPSALALESANQLLIRGNYFYLDEYLRQTVIINQEYKPLCQAGCRGICAGCGSDLNQSECCCAAEDRVDYRLAKLRDFVFKS